MPEKCPSCGSYMTVEEVFGTTVLSEMSDHSKRTTRYAFTSLDESEEELCPSCRRALKRNKTGEITI